MVSLNFVKIFVSYISTDIIKTAALALAVQKIDFSGAHFGGFLRERPQKISGDKTAFAAQQLYTKIRFQRFVVITKSYN